MTVPMITTTATRTTVTTTSIEVAASESPRLAPAALLELMRLASPALPVGGFSYSEVLEAAVDCGRVSDAETARRWLLEQLHLSLSRCDLPVLVQAHDAWSRNDLSRVQALNSWATTTRETRELQLQAQQMGRSLSEWLRQRAPGDAQVAAATGLAPAPSWPVVFALAAVRCGAPVHDSALAFALGWAENTVQAAIKAIPLGQNAGQRLLDALVAALPTAVDAALALPDDRWQAFAPMLAILSAQHETQYSRLFRS